VGFISAIAVLTLLSGCVLGRRTLTLPESKPVTVSAAKGTVYIAAITDDRHFENKPQQPSTPSIDGDVASLSAEQKDQMVGRQRNGYGHAMGDIALSQGDSVTRRVRSLVTQGLAQAGYSVSTDPSTPNKVSVSIKQFWSWSTPGFMAASFEVRIECAVSMHGATGDNTVTVMGYGINRGQVAKNENWLEAFDPAFQDFTKNFAARVQELGLRATR
jgi:hypothetical protein